jgi:hypothetical protein
LWDFFHPAAIQGEDDRMIGIVSVPITVPVGL